MFKIGQKIVCIDTSKADNLILNEIYTVTGTVPNIPNTVTIKEVKPNRGTLGFWAWRFRAIQTDWVDDILCRVTKEVGADELVSV